MTLTVFLLKIRGTLTLFRLNAQPILQNFPNKGSVKIQISVIYSNQFSVKIFGWSVLSFVM